MNLLGILAGSVGTISVALIAYVGARAVQRATARKLAAEAEAATTTADATAEKSAVDGYDLLTGRLETRLAASEQRETDLLERLASAEQALRDAQQTISALRSEVGDLRRQLNAYIDEDHHA